MNQNTWQQLTSHETLLALGVTLVMIGIILRGFARNSRRDRARRKQHLLDERNPDAAGRGGPMDQKPGWFEEHLSFLANAVLVAGILITLLAFLRN